MAQDMTKPQGRRRAKQPAEDARERLLVVALDLFARFGFDGVSTNMVAKAAMLSQPMVYYHFRSKEDLWQEAIRYLMHDLGHRFPKNRDELKDLSPAAQLKVITRRFLRMSAADSRLSQLIILESMSRSERLNWFAKDFIASAFADFDMVIEQGIAIGQIKPLPLYTITNTLVAACSLTFCVSPLVQQIYKVDVSEAERVDELADAVVDIIFNGILSRQG